MDKSEFRNNLRSAILSGSLSEEEKNFLLRQGDEIGIDENEFNKMLSDELSAAENNTANKTSADESADSSGFEVSGNDEASGFETSAEDGAENNSGITSVANQFTDISTLSTSGAMSVIQLAKWHSRWVIVKRIKPEFNKNPKYTELFFKEFETAISLDHENIARVITKGEDSEGSYFVMERVDGAPLTQMMSEGKTKDEKFIKRFSIGVLDALSYIHKKQIYHRDLKPDNILVTFKGQNPKIIDFGIARADDFEDLKNSTFIGTKKYAAPEQFGDPSKVDGRCDIYSYGLILLEMLTGQITNKDTKVVTNKLYAGIIDKCLKENPDERFFDADEIVDLLRNSSSVSGFSSVEKPKTKSSKKLIYGSLVLLLIIAGVAAIMFYKNNSSVKGKVKDFASENIYTMDSAKKYAENRDYGKAIETYTNLLKKDSLNQDLFLERGSTLLEMKKYDEALKDFDKTISINPSNGKAYLKRGITKFEQKNFKDSKVDLEKSKELDPSNNGAAGKYISEINKDEDLKQKENEKTSNKQNTSKRKTTEKPVEKKGGSKFIFNR
ncbi:MAG: protein kinase domain-containing protein [Ignavibacteria bacterium]